VKARNSALFQNHFGVALGSAIILTWAGLLAFNLTYEVQWLNPLTWVLVIVQTHLFTGLFITAHDAMHRTVSPHKKVNNFIGWIAAGLFAFNYYPKLTHNHYKHHGWVAEEEDPDYHDGPFWAWYFNFMKNYIGVIQVILMAITYNVLERVAGLQEANLLLYWVAPSFLSTLQLFYFGTYLPHKDPDESGNKHKSTTQAQNHVLAFLTCYFFGYHYEHHEYPATPWWLLYKVKEQEEAAASQ
jgi:beta-carotene ketolase (CrtW type)